MHHQENPTKTKPKKQKYPTKTQKTKAQNKKKNQNPNQTPKHSKKIFKNNHTTQKAVFWFSFSGLA